MDASTAIETIEVDTKKVACGGDGGALGHPKVYLEMGNKTEITCPYCSRHYVLKEGVEISGGH